MKIVRKLIQLHKILFFTALFFTFLSSFINLYWNSFLADMINTLGNISSLHLERETPLLQFLPAAVFLIVFQAASEYLSAYLASYTCEVFAHEMRMGYSRFYLQSNIRDLSKLNVGEEQSAMQNELREISSYLNENLFLIAKQFVSFAFTVVFFLCQSFKLTLLFTLPVIPLIIYCHFTGKMIKNFTEQSQESKKQINGLTGTLLELFPIIQIYDAYRLIDVAMRERLLKWKNSNMKREQISAKLMSLSGLLSFVPLLLLLGFGGFMVINGEISMGIFYIFLNLSGNVSGFLQNMPNIYAGFRRFGASVGRMERIWFHTQCL